MSVFIGDPGVDDALALAMFAIRDDPLSAVVATAGNVDVSITSAVAARLASAFGLTCPVQAARRVGLTKQPRVSAEQEPFHGADGFGGQLHELPNAVSVGEFQPEVMREAAVFVSGPLSPVAAGIAAGCRPSRVLWMGGAICGGNITAAAEFNAWCDPVAADAVIASGVPLQIVPLDVTTRVTLEERDFITWSSASATGSVLAAAFATLLRRGEATPHDAVAAAAWSNPELFQWEDRHVRCETDGAHTMGALVVDRRRRANSGPTRVAVDIDVESVRELITNSIASLD